MIDLTKPVQTRDGRKARVICTDMEGGSERIVALITNRSGGEHPLSYFKNGSYYNDDDSNNTDLINTPEELWVNVYPDGEAQTHSTRDRADNMATNDRIACLKFTEGEGL